ncbi:branched-chain amino acid aminotransferase [Phycisphaerales bacterium]|nr:branched-chain amino acid aminotransferase [Phycisphaerales bacterium]
MTVRAASRSTTRKTPGTREQQASAKTKAKAAKTPRVDVKKLPSLALRHIWAGDAGVGDKPFIWVNGQLQPKSKAMVSVYDHGLLYGDGVFEGIRVYNGKIFKCQSHMSRLYKCAEKIHLRIPVSPDDMVQIQRDCIAANGISDGYIRLVITRGYGTLGLDPRKCPVPGVICIADQIALYPPEFYESGMKVIVAKRPKTPVACLDPRIKSLNYLNNILAKVEAIEHGCHEAVMLSPEGWVTECTGDNIFVIKDGKIYTPPPVSGENDKVAGGLLEGVTRRFVIDTLAPRCGLDVEERMMRLEFLLAADEMFLTGTAAEIIAVPQIDETRISEGEGPITKKLRMTFREIVTSEEIPED